MSSDQLRNRLFKSLVKMRAHERAISYLLEAVGVYFKCSIMYIPGEPPTACDKKLIKEILECVGQLNMIKGNDDLGYWTDLIKSALWNHQYRFTKGH